MKALIDSINTWKLALLKVSLVAFVAGATTFQTSMSGVDWEVLSYTQKWLVVIGVGVTIANAVIAFLDRTISRITEGKPPVGDTTFIEKVKLP